MRPGLANLTKTDNGYSLKYPEAVQHEQCVPSSIMGMDDGQIEVMITMQLVTTEEEGWDAEQRDARADRMRQRLRKLREEHSSQTRKVWMIEMREWQMPSLQGILKALEAADKAHDHLVNLIRSGVHFVGPLQPLTAMQPGVPAFG